jgi:hypothetical protein
MLREPLFSPCLRVKISIMKHKKNFLQIEDPPLEEKTKIELFTE